MGGAWMRMCDDDVWDWGWGLWWGLSYHNRVSTTHYRFFYNRYPTQPVPLALTVWG